MPTMIRDVLRSQVECYAYFTCPDGMPGALWRKSAGGRELTRLGLLYTGR